MPEIFSIGPDVPEMILRMTAACILGGVIGFDRELRNRPAGLRTHMLVALAAALFTILTSVIYEQYARGAEDLAADPIRIIEAVTAGVAFLAAGAIIQSRGDVRGLTTGAGMWLSGALGVGCGVGRFDLAVPATVLAAIIVVLLRYLEQAMGHEKEAGGKPKA